MIQDNRLGIGTDIEAIERFARPIFSHRSVFLEKLFTSTEQQYCLAKRKPAEHLAARFAAKEAIMKALDSLGRRGEVNYRNIEITNRFEGTPVARILLTGFEDLSIQVSLSHEKDKAVAFALVAVKRRDNS